VLGLFSLASLLHLYLQVKLLDGLPQLEAQLSLHMEGLLLRLRDLLLLLHDSLHQLLLLILVN
jgi:hypothetical protein